jgi:phosphoribosyl 1,2-cyclic phosphate phosphodiesterase
MKLLFTGTGTSQGVPMIGCTCGICTSADPRDTRFRTAAVFFAQGQAIAIDTGPDFRSQMLRNKVSDLNAVLLTHSHKDHIAGLDDIRSFNFIHSKNMPLYADARTLARIRVEFDYAFSTEYPYGPQLIMNELDGQPFSVGPVAVQPIRVLHGGMGVYGFRIGNMAYITDANEIPDASMALLQGLDVLVLNALRHKAHYSHFTLSEALQVVEELKPKRAYFTHISHQLGLHADIERDLPPHIRLAYDGLVVEG